MTRMAAAVALAAALGGAPADLAAQTPAAADDPRETNLTAYVELLRADVRAQKVAVPHGDDGPRRGRGRGVLADLPRVRRRTGEAGDERIAMIKEYSAQHASMTDALAESLARKAIDVDRRRAALLDTYYERVKTALTPTVAPASCRWSTSCC